MSPNTLRLLARICVLPGAFGCSDSADPQAKRNMDEKARFEEVEIASIRRGPIRHESLTAEQVARISTLQKTFAEVDGSPLETWIDNFKRDVNPDHELAVWERIAKAYRSYCSGRELSIEAKKEIQHIALLRSMLSEDEVLKRLELRELSKADALEVMRDF